MVDSQVVKAKVIRTTQPLLCVHCGFLMLLMARSEAMLRVSSQRLVQRESIIDLISLIFGSAIVELAVGEVVIPDDDQHWRIRVADLLASLRTEDGGFAKTPEGRAGSTYQTFLSILCYQLIEIPVPDCEKIESFLNSQKQAEGGYLEIRAAKRAGVNPTAAAIGSLKALGKLNQDEQQATLFSFRNAI